MRSGKPALSQITVTLGSHFTDLAVVWIPISCYLLLWRDVLTQPILPSQHGLCWPFTRHQVNIKHYSPTLQKHIPLFKIIPPLNDADLNRPGVTHCCFKERSHRASPTTSSGKRRRNILPPGPRGHCTRFS